MPKKLLITRPNYDVATSYLYSFSKEIIKKIKGVKEIHMADLQLAKANRNNFTTVLSKQNPSLIFLNGHGDTTSVTGHKDESILDEKNINLTKDRIVYALACDSLEKLGKIAVTKEKAKAYIGYRASFMFVKDPSRTSSPDKDKNAMPFRKACFTLINSLIDGENVSKVIEKTKSQYEEMIRSYGTSEDDPYGDVPLIRFALAWDLEFLGMEGDPSVSF